MADRELIAAILTAGMLPTMEIPQSRAQVKGRLVVPVNPAHTVRGPRQVVRRGKTPVLVGCGHPLSRGRIVLRSNDPTERASSHGTPAGGEMDSNFRFRAFLSSQFIRLLDTAFAFCRRNRRRIGTEAISLKPAREAYLDGELCGIRPDGSTSFSLIPNASDTGNGDALVFFLFDFLHLDGEPVSQRPISERKERLRTLLSETTPPLQFSDHQIGRGRAFYEHACGLKLEGIVSKRGDAPYAPGNRGLWLKVKCLNREEFVVVGWTDPEGTRPHLGGSAARLL
jgi:hypothetical protein